MGIDNLIKGITIWDSWANAYNKFVPQFIEEAKNKDRWEDWDKKLFFEFFEKSNDQCVSSLQQGYYTNTEKEKIKNNWSELAPLLKKIAVKQDQIDLVTYNDIKKWLRKHTLQNRKAAVNRLIASLQPNLLCTVVNEDSLRILMQRINKLDSEAELKINGNWFENSNTVLEFFKNKLGQDDAYQIMTYPWQTYELLIKKENKINSNEMSEFKQSLNIKSLLEYKKQIILQGPPGTGKTKLAKEIAKEMIGETKSISDQVILENILVNQVINSLGGKRSYQVLEIKKQERKIRIKRESETEDYTSFDDVMDAYNSKLWQSKLEQNNARRAASLAKFIYDKFKNEISSNQYKLIQFHPSYTYEDFVRGIVAESKGEKIEYKNVNKTLGLFAEEALKNYKASNSNSSESNIEIWIDSKFEEFKNSIEAKLPEEEIVLSGDITIFEVTDSYFKYAKSWQTPGYLKFNEFKKIVKAILFGEFKLSNKQLDKEKFIHAHYRYTYYNALLKIFLDEYTYQGESYSGDPKNYILVIDEINRANLSSVLGELIYALEYRGESVESMYSVNYDNKLILPPNLYIIGTMNTADRSVGRIDYAIRRRFAFVDVLPENLKETQGFTEFDEYLFNEVADLFNINLSPEFEKNDVQLGHSYFIDKSKEKDGVPMHVRLEYEIKPILLEYVKDGVLIGENIKTKIEDLKASI